MNYWELRTALSKVIPRQGRLAFQKGNQDRVREKGRKTGYHQFNLKHRTYVKQERLLNTETIDGFLEVSCRAAACPMPLNLDVWDGLLCPFGCRYCFADAFRASLYTSFFDNGKSMGFRCCNPDYYMTEMDKLMELRGKDPHSIGNDVQKSIAMEIPIRFGIRFEDFLRQEKEAGVSLKLMRYLKDQEYPTMINTKSDLVGQDEYVEALANNPAGAAVHMTLISANQTILKKLEPGAPSYEKRIKAMKKLSEAGVRVVARIEPFLPFICDEPEMVQKYIEDVKATGCQNITFDTYSYSANNPGIRQAFYNQGYDWDRIFILGCDSQGLGSILLDKFMDLFRDEGFSCSTFDLGCAPTNSQSICCEVGDCLKGGFNWGSAVTAARYIIEQDGRPVGWQEFHQYVMERGGFLSAALEDELHNLWNMHGNMSYFVNWCAGVEPVGIDECGVVWRYSDTQDHRKDLLRSLNIEA